MSPTDANKALALASIEDGWNTRRLSVFDEIFAADPVDHSLPAWLPRTLEVRKTLIALYWRAFPDLRLTIEDQIAEDDKVVTRWTAPGTNRGELTGVPSANRSAAVTGISIDRFRAGKLVESWSQTNHPKMRPPR
jgi:predicted ester cyclase